MKGTGIDPREGEALILRGRRKGAAFQVTGFERVPRERDRIGGADRPLGPVVAGLTGRDQILKYTRVPTVPDWQLAKLMDFEVQEIATQAGEDLSADYNLLPIADEMAGEDIVLLALAKNDALETLSSLVESRNARVEAFTPNAVAIYNAYLMHGPVTEDEITLIAWMGESSIDLALVQGAKLLFARNVSGGLSILDSSIAQTFNVRHERAQKIRREILNLDPSARGSYGSSQEEKVAHSVAGVAGQLQAALRSTLAFCQSQTNLEDLRLDRVLLCGAGAFVRGMDRYLAEGLQTEVQVWDPASDLDLSSCPAEDGVELHKAGPEIVVALGLAMAPCFDDLYSIEILPEAVRRKRRFMERTILNIAAVLLALAYLAFHAVTAKSDYEALTEEVRKVESRLGQIQNTHNRAAKLIEGNKAMAEELDALVRQSVPMNGTVRLLRALRRHLPEDLWITKVTSEVGPAHWLQSGNQAAGSRNRTKVERRPYLRFEGRGVAVSGQSIDATYSRFQQSLMADPDIPKLVPSPGETADFRFLGVVDYLWRKSEKPK